MDKKFGKLNEKFNPKRFIKNSFLEELMNCEAIVDEDD